RTVPIKKQCRSSLTALVQIKTVIDLSTPSQKATKADASNSQGRPPGPALDGVSLGTEPLNSSCAQAQSRFALIAFDPRHAILVPAFHVGDTPAKGFDGRDNRQYPDTTWARRGIRLFPVSSINRPRKLRHGISPSCS